MNVPTINGVPADQYGLWCEHGKRLMVPDPNDRSEYPACRFADPWPCDVCAPEQVSAELDAEAAEYERDRWDEYWSLVGGGL